MAHSKLVILIGSLIRQEVKIDSESVLPSFFNNVIIKFYSKFDYDLVYLHYIIRLLMYYGIFFIHFKINKSIYIIDNNKFSLD